MGYTYKIDFEFVSKLEGGSRLTGYIPICDIKSVKNTKNTVCFGKDIGSVIGKSGVTIGVGFDLGQHNLYDLQQLQLPPSLQMKLLPYLLQKKGDAIEVLKTKPLVLTETEVSIINFKKKELHARQLEKAYNNDSRIKFANIPSEMQTALFSITYQYGLSSVRSTLKTFWQKAIEQNWDKMIEILWSYGNYQTRRRSEAELIKKSISANNKFLLK